jgi:hypothetical protein
VQDSYNLRGSRGLSDFDARHRFVFSGIYELPFHGNQLVEGWQLSSSCNHRAEIPVNIVVNNATFHGHQQYGATRCDGSRRDSRHVNRWFDIAPFVVPVGRFGGLGRNVVIGPGFNNTDFSVIKRTKLTEVS